EPRLELGQRSRQRRHPIPSYAPGPEFAVCGRRLEITPCIQGITRGTVEACAYRRPGFDRGRVPTALRLGLEIKGLFSSAGDQALVSRNQERESINPSGKIRPAATPCRP